MHEPAPRRSGGRSTATARIRFTFDGKPYVGHAGDTLASALLASGVTLFGRSFKYHRPRGVLTAGIDEPNALVTVLKGEIREPNIPATLLEIHDGLTVVSQNRFPVAFLRHRRRQPARGQTDLGRVLLQDLHGAGDRSAKGHAPLDVLRAFHSACRRPWACRLPKDPARYERMNAFCDVLVVGSGPAGLMAARAAAERGHRVILADLEQRFGGSANWSGETIDGMPAAD